MNHDNLIVTPGSTIKLRDFDPGFSGKFTSKDEAQEKLASDIEKLAGLQDVLYAQDTYSMLLIFQAMDAAGKDGIIKHVMSGVNPQGCQVFSFKAPSTEELDHDYLWRSMKALPERGPIGIFNRSYYEETLVVRVHPTILQGQRIPAREKNDKEIWKHRFADINNFERYLSRNGVVILKFFLNVSKKEQRKRFLERIDTPEKNWKFSANDIKERAFWDDYMKAYEDMIGNTATKDAPWYVVPADNKWFTRIVVAAAVIEALDALDLRYPKVGKQKLKELAAAKQVLLGGKQ